MGVEQYLAGHPEVAYPRPPLGGHEVLEEPTGAGGVHVGVPGRIVRSVTDEEVKDILWSVDHYVQRAREHAEGKYV